MQKVELTLEDDLHLGLKEAAKKSSQSVDQLIVELLRKSLRRVVAEPDFSEELLAEGYRVMADENSQELKELMPLQMQALAGDDGGS